MLSVSSSHSSSFPTVAVLENIGAVLTFTLKPKKIENTAIQELAFPFCERST